MVAELTIPEKVLLHLYRYRAFSGSFDVPEAMCQNGIAKGVGIRRSHVSGVLKGLRGKDLVEERIAHVRGAKRRRKVYQLSFKGGAEAKTLMDGLELEGIPIDRILTTVDDPARKEVSVMRPSVKYFFGRNEELKAFDRWLDDEVSRFIVIRGIPGIGKTTFLAKAMDTRTHEGRRKVFYYTIKGWCGLHSLLASLSRSLAESGVISLARVVQQDGPHPLDVDAAAASVLEVGDLLMVLDDCHNADEKTVQFLTALLQADAGTNLKIAIAGRAIPMFFSQRDSKVTGRVKELSLEGLGPEDCQRLYEEVSDGNDFEWVFEASKGHPLSIELIGLAGGSTIDRSRFIFEEIYSLLSEEEKVTLAAASIYREPVPVEGIFIDPRISYKAIDDLQHRGLLTSRSGLFRVHDVVKDFFYEHLSPKERTRLHRKASDFYLEQGGDGPWLEAHYHLIRCDEHKRSATLLGKRASELLRRGYHEEVMKIIEGIKDKELDVEMITVLKVEAEVQNLRGEHVQARKTCMDLLELSMEHGDDRSWTQGQILLGAIAYSKGELEEALSCYGQALTVAERNQDRINLAKVLNNLGIIHWRKDDTDQAVQFYERSLELAKEMDDRPGIARTLANLGVIHHQNGELEVALGSYSEALGISEEIGDKKTAAILFCNIGEVHMARKEPDTARQAFETSFDLAKDVGFKEQMDEARRHLDQMARPS